VTAELSAAPIAVVVGRVEARGFLTALAVVVFELSPYQLDLLLMKISQ
jgi:hypothetical protein